jgi:hypothetical protein
MLFAPSSFLNTLQWNREPFNVRPQFPSMLPFAFKWRVRAPRIGVVV